MTRNPMNWPPFLLPACLAGLLLPLVPTHLAAYPAGTKVWLIDLASHWQWLFLLGLVYSCMIAMRKSIRWGVVLLALPLPWLTASQPAPFAGMGAPSPNKILSIATANVHLDNGSAKALGQWIDRTSPDLVVLNEVSPAYALELERIEGYPYRYLLPSDDPFGIGLLSRFPLSGIRTIPSENGSRHVEAQIIWGTTSVALTAIHPMSPISPQEHNNRNLQLAAVAAAAKSAGQPSIIVGDLNTTPWSSAFSGIEDTGVRRATGLSPTWPSIGQGWLGIPIDHVLVTPHWSVLEQQLGPNIGSDHLPVLVKIGLV
jgi:endonuclease/exonuclease/phosphatase (EEP) superfamily protein YafD